eukprot:PhM_4_TR7647/c0_g1_i1/m.89802
MSNNNNEFQQWLGCLAPYASAMAGHGYDSLEVLACLAADAAHTNGGGELTSGDLMDMFDAIGMTKQGHRILLKKKLQVLVMDHSITSNNDTSKSTTKNVCDDGEAAERAKKHGVGHNANNNNGQEFSADPIELGSEGGAATTTSSASLASSTNAPAVQYRSFRDLHDATLVEQQRRATHPAVVDDESSSDVPQHMSYRAVARSLPVDGKSDVWERLSVASSTASVAVRGSYALRHQDQQRVFGASSPPRPGATTVSRSPTASMSPTRRHAELNPAMPTSYRSLAHKRCAAGENAPQWPPNLVVVSSPKRRAQPHELTSRAVERVVLVPAGSERSLPPRPGWNNSTASSTSSSGGGGGVVRLVQSGSSPSPRRENRYLVQSSPSSPSSSSPSSPSRPRVGVGIRERRGVGDLSSPNGYC